MKDEKTEESTYDRVKPPSSETLGTGGLLTIVLLLLATVVVLSGTTSG